MTGVVGEEGEEALCLQQRQVDGGAELEPVSPVQVKGSVAAQPRRPGTWPGRRGCAVHTRSLLCSGLRRTSAVLTGLALSTVVGFGGVPASTIAESTDTAPCPRGPTLQLRGLGAPAVLGPLHELQSLLQVLRPDAHSHEAATQFPKERLRRNVHERVEKLREGYTAHRVCVHGREELVRILFTNAKALQGQVEFLGRERPVP
mmetsp:Transcript_31692/g.67379  ORF Transcript_31692/g.67379 Transcript_31692/m.67379 type:complete len:203 (-) Transcript_31692:832-1440(-)